MEDGSTNYVLPSFLLLRIPYVPSWKWAHVTITRTSLPTVDLCLPPFRVNDRDETTKSL